MVAVVLGGRSAASRDNTMAELIGDNLPRAYAGARIAPPVGEGGSREVMVADASPAATDPGPERARRDRGGRGPARLPRASPSTSTPLRPVVASAAGASGTTTPSSGVRWQKGAQPLPLNAQAFAALQEADEISETREAGTRGEDRSPRARRIPPPQPARQDRVAAKIETARWSPSRQSPQRGRPSPAG